MQLLRSSFLLIGNTFCYSVSFRGTNSYFSFFILRFQFPRLIPTASSESGEKPMRFFSSVLSRVPFSFMHLGIEWGMANVIL